MVNVGKGRLFRRGNKYMIYIPKDVAQDTMFPLKSGETSIPVEISYEVGGNVVVVKKWKEKESGS